jgi:hypothetical protein
MTRARARHATKQSLADLHPRVAAEWHPTKNGELTPEDVAPYGRQRAWWRCSKDSSHVWSALIASRTRLGTGCPACSGRVATPTTSLRVCFPSIAAQWHPVKNRPLTPDDVTPHSARVCWWKCADPGCGYVWQAMVNSRTRHRARTRGEGCPACQGRVVTPRHCLAACYPAVAREWHPTKNGALTPKAVAPSSATRAWWRCAVDPAHVWEAQVSNRTSKGSGCPFCARRRGKRATATKR